MYWCQDVIFLSGTDSTNNYAMQLIDADKAQHGLTVVAGRQFAGKGQRGRQWQDQDGESLLMSCIVKPQLPVSQQFLLSAAIAAALAGVVQDFLPGQEVAVKWPNDIIINDKKAGGILIENVLRGATWTNAVIGFGLNVAQNTMPADLPHATSLALAGGSGITPETVLPRARAAIRQAVALTDASTILRGYERWLYRLGSWQDFQTPCGVVSARITGVQPDGRLCLQLADLTGVQIWHGEWAWLWPC